MKYLIIISTGVILITFFTFQIQHSLDTSAEKKDAFFPVKEYGRWGFINAQGQKVIECIFDQVGRFSNNAAAVKSNGLWGFINTKGKMIIQPQYEKVDAFSEGLAYINHQKKQFFINKDGSVVFYTDFDVRGRFNNGRARIIHKEKVCYINTQGQIVIRTKYSNGLDFKEGIAYVWNNDSQYLDTTGKIIAQYSSMGNDGFSEGLASVSDHYESFYIDKTGKKKLKFKDSRIYGNFSDGLAQVTIPGYDHKTGFIDKSGKLVMEIKYSRINDFKEGLAAYYDQGKWGFINKKGEIAIPPTFAYVGYDGFQNGLCEATHNRRKGYINHQGKFVWQEQVDIPYKKITLSQWKLDTLESQKPMYNYKRGGYFNPPRKGNFIHEKALVIKVDTSDISVYRDKYFAYKIYVINGSKKTIQIPAQDNHIKLIQQAKNLQGKWQDIEGFINSFCGHSYHKISVKPGYFQIYAAPIVKGSTKTKLRFKLVLRDQILYSNEYAGSVNQGQFLKPKDQDQTKPSLHTSGR
ncbi:hypothetical protein BKI52_08230 [marine bacterium AO1-C]|nr:hypothetical protein BKI52_08230 [marine bacterium AO1-C]